ncbi:MAG TPA: DegT/DnrJ/EryC1/StrS family aminotransferase, partial [Kofleriaceae bacterium]|nr:DegT/DnrJ/EryC1/StrS family aminotransferase [Kofleriaceae bacterium]
MTPPRASFLPFALPDVGDEEAREVTEVLRSGWVTTGPKVREFEQQFAAYVGARHAVAVNSCTAALHLALEAIGLGPGDRVVTTPYTFAATAEVIRYFQATPVFVDVEPTTLNLDPARLDAAMAGAKAVIPVHVAGEPCRLAEIQAIAARHGAKVIEDAAHALPTRLGGRLIGALSDVTCFSFYATKSMTTGEGGMLCTDDDAVADRCRIMSLHGISRDAWKRYMADGSWYYEIVAPGYKYNLTDLAAALGVVQLRKVDAMWARRRDIARRYHDAFAGLAELERPHFDPAHQHAWHLYMLRLHLDRLGLDRAAFVTELKRRNIGASVHFIPLHLHPYYRETYGYRPEDFPVAWREYQREVSLPIYSRMTDADVDDVIAAVT